MQVGENLKKWQISVKNQNKAPTHMIKLDGKLKGDKKKYLIGITLLIVINTILFGLLIKGSRTENFLVALNANLIGLNIVGFILGTIVAIFPKMDLIYSKKYLRASLLTIFTIQLIETIGLSIIGIMTLAGWY